MEFEKVCKGLCPKCGSANLEYEDYVQHEDSLNAEFTCMDCGAQGWEEYTLVYKVSVVSDEQE